MPLQTTTLERTPAEDLVWAEDYDRALILLERRYDLAGPYGRRVLERAGRHLTRLLDAHLHRGPLLDTEHAAQALLKTQNQHLSTAGYALDRAAAQLKQCNRGVAASQARAASAEALQAAGTPSA